MLFLTAGRAQADTVSFSRETPSIPTMFTGGRNNGRHSPSWLCQQPPNEREAVVTRLRIRAPGIYPPVKEDGVTG